ncbi:hypothetical protein BASA60_004312 [Batrachochytrium salamandrivorans]|nr:hypothetical protein BASA60_004312 [Batrachochytrium salamandrivorans]
MGNNAITSNPSGKTTPSTSNGVFDTQFNSIGAPTSDANIAAAAVNLFYFPTLCMISHTSMAFTESAGTSKRTTLARADKAMTLPLLMFLTLPILMMPPSSLLLMDNHQ